MVGYRNVAAQLNVTLSNFAVTAELVRVPFTSKFNLIFFIPIAIDCKDKVVSNKYFYKNKRFSKSTSKA